MNTTIEQRLKEEIRHMGVNHATRRYLVMREELERAIKPARDLEYFRTASVMEDIIPVLDSIIETVKYYPS